MRSSRLPLVVGCIAALIAFLVGGELWASRRLERLGAREAESVIPGMAVSKVEVTDDPALIAVTRDTIGLVRVLSEAPDGREVTTLIRELSPDRHLAGSVSWFLEIPNLVTGFQPVTEGLAFTSQARVDAGGGELIADLVARLDGAKLFVVPGTVTVAGQPMTPDQLPPEVRSALAPVSIPVPLAAPGLAVGNVFVRASGAVVELRAANVQTGARS